MQAKVAADFIPQSCQMVLELDHSDVIHIEGKRLVTSVLSQHAGHSLPQQDCLMHAVS